jgi:hypothetical protein
MSDDYLWDRSGPPDGEVERLEKQLGTFGYRSGSFDDRHRGLKGSGRPEQPKSRLGTWESLAMWVAVAAALIVLIPFAGHYSRGTHTRDSGWTIWWSNAPAQALHRGQTVQTGYNFSARLSAAAIGEVTLEPGSRLRMLEANTEEQQLALDRGTIHAFIWAPPRQFRVNVPSATTVDLGCRYSLNVSADGTGTLHVEMGWVAFEWKHLEAFIPAGASCETQPHRGPGIPYFDDAPLAMLRALKEYEQNQGSGALHAALSLARPRDAISIWHLLTRTNGQERMASFARFSELVKLPDDLTKERVMEGDPSAIDEMWNALDLGDTKWWRTWKRPW